MTETTLSVAVSATSNTFTVASASGVEIGMLAAIDTELAEIVGLNGRVLTVQRGAGGTGGAAHDAGATVSIGTPDEFANIPAPVPFGPDDTVLSGLGPTLPPTFAAGGGGGLLHQATVTLTNDQILTLPTTGVEIVAAQGANTIIVPVSAVARLDNSAGIYTAVEDASWLLALGDTYPSSVVVAESMLGVEGVYTAWWLPAAYVGSDTFANEVVGGYSSGDMVNQALSIEDSYGGIPDYEGGNEANTLKVSVTFLVLNTATGVFV